MYLQVIVEVGYMYDIFISTGKSIHWLVRRVKADLYICVWCDNWKL